MDVLLHLFANTIELFISPVHLQEIFNHGHMLLCCQGALVLGSGVICFEPGFAVRILASRLVLGVAVRILDKGEIIFKYIHVVHIRLFQIREVLRNFFCGEIELFPEFTNSFPEDAVASVIFNLAPNRLGDLGARARNAPSDQGLAVTLFDSVQ